MSDEAMSETEAVTLTKEERNRRKCLRYYYRHQAALLEGYRKKREADPEFQRRQEVREAKKAEKAAAALVEKEKKEAKAAAKAAAKALKDTTRDVERDAEKQKAKEVRRRIKAEALGLPPV
jgi:hypothetical protein